MIRSTKAGWKVRQRSMVRRFELGILLCKKGCRAKEVSGAFQNSPEVRRASFSLVVIGLSHLWTIEKSKL